MNVMQYNDKTNLLCAGVVGSMINEENERTKQQVHVGTGKVQRGKKRNLQLSFQGCGELESKRASGNIETEQK